MTDATELDTMDAPRVSPLVAALVLIVGGLACWGIIYLLGLILGLV
jgi:hypothetical protein